MAKFRSGDSLRASIRAFMEARGLNVHSWAKAAKISEGTLRNFLSGASQTLTYLTLQSLAEAEKVKVSLLIGDDPFGDALFGSVGAEDIIVTIRVEENVWRASWFDVEALYITLPPDPRYPSANRVGALVADESVDRLFPSGAILICTKLVDIGRAIEAGDKVLFLRTRTGEIETLSREKISAIEHEVSIKEAVMVEGKIWLTDAKKDRVYRSYILSDKPQFISHDGVQYYEWESGLFGVAAIVTASYRLE